MDVRQLVGLDYLNAITALLQRARLAHATSGIYEAAELQWWWTRPSSTDTFPQLFWFDDADQPVAAVTVNDMAEGSSLVYREPILVVSVMPDATADFVTHIVSQGLGHLDRHGIHTTEIEIDQNDALLVKTMSDHGFTRRGDAIVGCWLDTNARPEISPLHDGYRLLSRAETRDQGPHHMASGRRPDPELRFTETSLYQPQFDLAVFDDNGDVAAQALFWHDPITATGVVEPVRTLDDHQRRGLSRHLLTTGIDLLARAGAKRVNIGYEPDNPASSHLYPSIGFEPQFQSDLYSNGG